MLTRNQKAIEKTYLCWQTSDCYNALMLETPSKNANSEQLDTLWLLSFDGLWLYNSHLMKK